MLELRHVGFETDDNKEILRDVSLTVQDRFVAITGPNGSSSLFQPPFIRKTRELHCVL